MPSDGQVVWPGRSYPARFHDPWRTPDERPSQCSRTAQTQTKDTSTDSFGYVTLTKVEVKSRWSVKKLKFVVSLTTDDNDYQMEQAVEAAKMAAKLGVEIQIMYAENDAIVQSQQLLKIIQSNTEPHPDGIIFEP